MDDFLFRPTENRRRGFFENEKQPLCFDDGTIGPINGHKGDRKDSLPASALEQWKLSIRTQLCTEAVAAIIVRDLRFLSQVDYDPKLELRIRELHRLAVEAADWGETSRCCEILGVFASDRGKVRKADSWYLKSIDALLSMEKVNRWSLERLLTRYEKFLNSADKSEGWLSFKLDILMRAAFKNKDFYDCRYLALKMYKHGEYEKAERSYLKLIEEGFTVASNYCHLVRLRITADRIEEAEQALDEAVASGDVRSLYVMARIHFFNVVFRFIKGTNAREDLRKLNALLENSSAYLQWEIDSMLGCIQNRVTEKQYALLCALGTALQSPSCRSVLDENLLWVLSVSEDEETGMSAGASGQTQQRRRPPRNEEKEC